MPPSRSGYRALLLAALLAAASGDTSAEGVFDHNEELAVVLEFPLRTLLRNRRDREEYPGRLLYRGDDGELVTVPLEIRARGYNRVEVCAFPPLRLDFKHETGTSTLFAGIDELKLVTQCRRRPRHRSYLQIEYLIYRAWEQLSPYAFRTRALSVSYRDTERDGGEYTQFAFLIEDTDDLAARLGTQRIRSDKVLPGAYAPENMNLLELFQYLIGNTDWSAYFASGVKEHCCHNGQPITTREDPERLALLPYDFDNAGLVDAEYAVPHEKLNIRSVRQRLYRGLCRHNDLVPRTVERLNSARGELEALFRDQRLSGRASGYALDYIDSFYAIVNDPQRLQRQVLNRCRRAS